MLTFCTYILISSFSIQPRVIREKSTAGWPVPIIISGTAISFLWLLHGIVMRENFVILQNGVVVLMSVVQLAFIVAYPATVAPKAKKSSGKSQKLKNEKKKIQNVESRVAWQSNEHLSNYSDNNKLSFFSMKRRIAINSM